jgi:fructose-bisphosphate aldolase class II
VYLTENPKIDFERFEVINQIVNRPEIRAPLIIHGGTGLKDDVVRRLVRAGGAKFNVSTELKHVLLDTTRRVLDEEPGGYNPGKVDKEVRAATRRRVEAYIELLGSEGRA